MRDTETCIYIHGMYIIRMLHVVRVYLYLVVDFMVMTARGYKLRLISDRIYISVHEFLLTFGYLAVSRGFSIGKETTQGYYYRYC